MAIISVRPLNVCQNGKCGRLWLIICGQKMIHEKTKNSNLRSAPKEKARDENSKLFQTPRFFHAKFSTQNINAGYYNNINDNKVHIHIIYLK